MSDCPRHKHCAYTGSVPGLCPICHATETKCKGSHGGPPYTGWTSGVAGPGHASLKPGQYHRTHQ